MHLFDVERLTSEEKGAHQVQVLARYLCLPLDLSLLLHGPTTVFGRGTAGQHLAGGYPGKFIQQSEHGLCLCPNG